MADQITDNRTLVHSFDSLTDTYYSQIDDDRQLDDDTTIEGSNSVGFDTEFQGTRVYMAADLLSATDQSNKNFWFWGLSSVQSKLETKANGGVAIRFAGADVDDWFEVYVAGSDIYPVTFSGGWAQYVVNIEKAAASPDATNGTPPATSAIQYVGISVLMATNVGGRNTFWIDALWSLDEGEPAIIVEGRESGLNPWTFNDIRIASEAGSWGVVKGTTGGAFALNGPIQFGVDDTTTHELIDINAVLLWDDQEWINDGFYELSVVGNSGGNSTFELGLKNGTGINATGAQGGSISAASTGVRWNFDGSDPDVDTLNLYGVSMTHGGDFQLDVAGNEVISSLLIDITTVEASGINVFFNNAFINSNTVADGGALIWNENVDVDGILDGGSFGQGSTAHHAIEFGTAVASDMVLRGIAFDGFSGTDDVDGSTLQFLATTGSLNLSLIDCTVDGAAATLSNIGIDDAAGISVTVIIAPVTLTITVKNKFTLAVIQDVQTSIHLKDTPFTELMNEDTDAGGIATESYSGTVPVDVVWKCRKSEDTDDPRYFGGSSIETITSNGLEITVLLEQNPFLI